MFDLSTLICRIGSVQHFKNLTIQDLKTIVTSGQLLNYPAESTILSEEQSCSGLFVLLKGKVHLCKSGPRGQDSIIGVIKPVIMFNEVAVIDKGENPVTAIAANDSITWQISCERFHFLMEKYPPLGISLLRVLASRNRQLISQCEDIAFRTVLGRTAKILLELSHNGQKAISRREHTNQELAAKAATVAEPISRSINTLKQLGAIECTRDKINICSAEQLAELAEVYLELSNN